MSKGRSPRWIACRPRSQTGATTSPPPRAGNGCWRNAWKRSRSYGTLRGKVERLKNGESLDSHIMGRWQELPAPLLRGWRLRMENRGAFGKTSLGVGQEVDSLRYPSRGHCGGISTQ